MSNLLKHARVMGMSDAAVDRGVIQWPTPQIGFEVTQKIAAYCPDGAWSPETALEIGRALKTASEEVAKTYGAPGAEAVLQMKTAAAYDFSERAALVAEACMAKAASDNASLTSVGQNTAESAAQTDQSARLDQKNRPGNKYNLGVGKTQMPSGGVVGMQASAGSVDVSNVMNSLTALDKQAALSLYVATLPEGAEKQAALKIAEGGDGPAKAKLLERILDALREARSAVSAPLAPGARDAFAFNKVLGIPTSQNLMDVAGPGLSELAGHRGVQTGAAALGTAGAALGAKALYDRFHGAPPSAPPVAEDPSKQVQANENMNVADLGAGADPGAGAAAPQGVDPSMLERAMMFMRALKDKIPGLRPSPEAQVAAGGLAQQGEPGMQVMAAALDQIKTAEDADEIIAQILNHQGQAGELASPELVQVIQQLMAEHGGDVPDEPKVAAFIARHTQPAPKTPKTASEILASIKRAADGKGSLTSVGANTPESAAKTDQSAKLDQENRSTNAYSVPQGKTKLPNTGQQLAVSPAPKAEDPTNPNTTPSRETKSAADAAYEAEFDKVASVFVPHLPATFTVQQKVAAVQALMGMPPAARTEYVLSLARS